MDGRRSYLGALLAAGSLFTRLPFWRLRELTKEDYEDALSWWPVMGLLTGSVLGGSFLLYALILPPGVALVLALVTRLLLTGGFHEDGLGDFFDGFGGGRTREQVLAIMKDSHVGSYAVLSFVLYYLLYWASAVTIPAELLPVILLASDLTGKAVSFLQVQLLPYARRESGSKVGVVYRKAGWLPLLSASGVMALLLWALTSLGVFTWYGVALMLAPPLLLGLGLMGYIRKRIGGYTGDTCGAICLLAELATLLYFTWLTQGLFPC